MMMITVPMMLVMFTWWQITMIVVKMMIVTMATQPPIRSHTFQKLQFRWKVGDLVQFHRWFKRLSILSVLA